MPPPLRVSIPGESSTFDRLAFVKYVKNIGRPYRKQAIQLISICRTFVQAQEQTFSSYAELRSSESALQVADDALKSATKAEQKTSEDVDKRFEMAINALSEYERRQHSRETVHKVMAEAKARDKSSATVLDRLKEKFRPTEDVLTEQTMTVRFLLHKSLLDTSPTIVQQVLSKKSSLQEVLWNFSHFKNKNQRVTLKQNPHFYQALPKSPGEYGREFRADPIETFQHATISVLTDNPNRTGRVFLETAHKRRVFGNAWAANDVIIFKDVCGKLEGESIVGADIQDTPNMWYFEEPPLSLTSRSSSSPRWNTLSPTMSAMSTNPIEGLPLRDWREPIHRMLRAMQSLKVNIHITAKSPIDYPPSPVRQVSSSGLGRILLPNMPSKCRPSIKLLIPALSSGPSTPSVYRTARDTPLSQRYPAAELSPGIPEPSFPTSPPVSPPQPTSTAATPSPVALSVSHLCRPFSIAPAPAGRANTATPITRTLADDSQPEGRGSVLPQEARIPSQAPISEAVVLPPGLDAACDFPRRTGRTLRRHEEGNEGEIIRHVSTQVPGPGSESEHEDATRMPLYLGGATNLPSDPGTSPPPAQAPGCHSGTSGTRTEEQLVPNLHFGL